MVDSCPVSESSQPLPWLPSLQRQPVAIAARNIQMMFRSGLSQMQVLKGVDLTVKPGEVRLLMGPSGSGKTTLLSILAGILTPTAGEVELLGHNITQMSRRDRTRFRRHHLGFVFQDFNLFPALTAAENIELTLKIKDYPKASIQPRVQALLAQVGLAEVSQRLPQDLSGGQKQRVAIARALAAEPQILMADEPTAALDSKTGRAVVELMSSLAREQGCAILIITHDPRITDIADHITYLEDGRISASPSWES